MWVHWELVYVFRPRGVMVGNPGSETDDEGEFTTEQRRNEGKETKAKGLVGVVDTRTVFRNVYKGRRRKLGLCLD